MTRPRSATWRSEVSGSWTGRWSVPRLFERPINDAERRVLVALSLAGCGPGRIASRLESGERLADLVRAADSATAAKRLDDAGARAITPADYEYPPWLRSTASPPLVLFVRGRRLDELAPMVAVVGARTCTSGGAKFSSRICEEIARAGFVVVSGLARGIDVAAHRGALRGGRTVAVLGSGIDVVYPAEHAELAARVASSGAVVSEFPPGVTPRQWHFPARNRVIAGMAMAVVVVEAGTRSGALITADFALDEGRELFACTVAPESPSGAGVRTLLRDGARLVVDPEQLVEDLMRIAADQQLDVSTWPAGLGADAPGAAARAPLDGDRRAVFEAVLENTTVDEIVARTAMTAGRVASTLTDLELDGLVSDDGGGRWRRR